MKKLTYAIALSSLLLAGCSQDEGIKESKGELVTLNYNVSLGNGVQSRTGETPELAVNKLICAVFEDEIELYREVVDVNSSGKASFTPKLLDNTDYQIVFWAYYEHQNEEGEIVPVTCYELEDLTCITINDNYDKEVFEVNAKKDAFTFVDDINLTENISEGTRQITLTRPFGQINVLTSVTDFEAAQTASGSEPESSELIISGHNDVFNALEKKWYSSTSDVSSSKSKKSITLHSTVSKEIKKINGIDFYYLSNEYLFSSGANATCTIKVYNANNDLIYNKDILDMPISANANTNLYNENLLTGTGITYDISIEQDTENDENKGIEGNTNNEGTEDPDNTNQGSSENE